ncbi:MAG: DUF3332 domain-containing protein [Muribaculaceae bacterium]|nr:DUF3332 domain-containing protein [Muribaculaceae bacterium]
MKSKKIVIFTASALLLSVSLQSCIGSFALTNKVLSWNKNVNNKFVNELVFFVFWVLPVYEVTAVADLLVINSIEFWSGNNPMEANNKVIKTEHGDYQLYADANGYKVTSPDGNLISFDFDIDNQTWSFRMDEGEKTEFLKFKDADHVEILNGEGNFVDVELSREGVDAYAASLGMPMMAKY